MEQNNNQNMQEEIAYIKSMINRTQKVIDPGAYFFILWGGIIIIGNGILPLFYHTALGFLLDKYWLAATPIGIVLSIAINTYICSTDTKNNFTLLSKQIGLLWATFGGSAILILLMTLFFQQQLGGIFGFIIYLLVSMMLFATGIIYLPEYYVAGILVFSTNILSYLYPTVAAISLTGFLVGGSLVMLGTLALIRLNRK